MSDDLPNSDPSTPPPAVATPAATPSNPPDIQAMIDAAAQKAHNAAWKQARETFEKKSPATGGNERPAATSAASPHVDVSQEIARHRAFDRAVGKYDLSDKALGIIEAEFAAAKPSDPTAWFSERAEAFSFRRHGQSAASVTTPPATAPAAAPQPSGPPVTSNGAPSSPTAITDDTPILRLSPADQLALQKRIGVKAFTDRMTKEFREHGTRVRLR